MPFVASLVLLIVFGTYSMASRFQVLKPPFSTSVAAAATQAGQPAKPATPLALPLDDEGTAYVCPMHSDYTSDTPGTCPRCGMHLVLATPFDMRDYRLDLQMVPPVVKAGETIKLLFRIFHPGSGKQITRFEIVHDRPYHVFVISQDMEYFAHIHPQRGADGTWSIDLTLPKPGHYKVLSDFLPSGGSSQFIARPLVTAGYTGDLMADSAHLVPDTFLTKKADDLTATVTYDPKTFVAGQYGHLMFRLSDTETRQPISDLQTYLGAFGHTLIMSEDMVEYVHSHPIEQLPPNANLEALRGGPAVTFEGLMPKPGHYRAWTQFRRNDKVHTFAYTFDVVDVGQLR
jgi:hypothetical protein